MLCPSPRDSTFFLTRAPLLIHTHPHNGSENMLRILVATDNHLVSRVTGRDCLSRCSRPP